MILIRIELVWHKNLRFSFFFIKCMFCFSFLHHLENYCPWILLYCLLSIPKGQKENSEFFNGLVSYHIISYRYHFVSIGIVSYRKKNKRYTSLVRIRMVCPSSPPWGITLTGAYRRVVSSCDTESDSQPSLNRAVNTTYWHLFWYHS